MSAKDGRPFPFLLFFFYWRKIYAASPPGFVPQHAKGPQKGKLVVDARKRVYQADGVLLESQC